MPYFGVHYYQFYSKLNFSYSNCLYHDTLRQILKLISHEFFGRCEGLGESKCEVYMKGALIPVPYQLSHSFL